MNIIEFFGTTVKPFITNGRNMLNPLETGQINKTLFSIRDKDVNVFIIKSKNKYIAIDSGYKNSENMKKGLKELNIDGRDITDVFITHLDLDHAGGIDCRCYNIFPNAKIYISKEEEKYLKLKYFRKKVLFFNLKVPIKISQNYICLEDKNIVNIEDTAIEVVYTPGHTLGHTSYIINDNILFSGDSLILNEFGGFCMYDLWNVDTELNISSLENLKKIISDKNCKLIITSHTGFTDNISEAFKHIYEVPNWKDKNFKFIKDAPYNLYK